MQPRDPNCGTPVKPERLLLTPSMVPRSPNFDAKESRYFKKFTNLPSPEEVRKQAKTQQLARACSDNRKSFSIAGPHVRPPPVILDDLGLFVKWGSAVRISEGQCLYAIGQLLKDHVPVPELYGWREDGDETFIYMEYLDAQTLEQAWDALKPGDRISVCGELRKIYDKLRQLEQEPEDPFIGRMLLAAFIPFHCIA